MTRATTAPLVSDFSIGTIDEAIDEYSMSLRAQNKSPATITVYLTALQRLNGHAPKRWLELVLGMRRKEYRTSRRPGTTWREYQRKVGCTVTVAPRDGFDVTIAGYWIRPNGGDRPHCQEAVVHVPWSKRAGM